MIGRAVHVVASVAATALLVALWAISPSATLEDGLVPGIAVSPPVALAQSPDPDRRIAFTSDRDGEF